MSLVPQNDEQLNTQLAKYQKENCNILLPTRQIMSVSQFFRPVLEEVYLSIEAGDVYPMESAWDISKCNKFAPSKNGLLKLMNCAGVMIDPVHTRRIDDMHDRNYVAFEVVGALKKADNSLFIIKGSYELDLTVVEDEIREAKWAQAERMDGKNDAPWKDEAGMEKWVESKVTAELLKKRRYKLPLCETGAMLRMIRAILTVQNTYTRPQLLKPFVVPKIVFAPDMNDPTIRKALLTAAVQGMANVYGSIPEKALSEATDVSHMTGETYEAPENPRQIEAGSPSPPAPPAPAVQPEEAPFGAPLPTLPASTTITSVADYEELEKHSTGENGDTACPQLIEELERLRTKYNIKVTKPIFSWTQKWRREFVTKIFGAEKK